MAAPKTTIWALEPHTRAKHEILRRYLQAWVPILTQGGFPRVLYIDGFAGPGRYSKGEDGSPIIALRAALEHKATIRGTISFLFVELDKERAAVLSSIAAEIASPPNFQVRVVGCKPFEEAFRELQQSYLQGNGRLPPTFAFIDPFGWPTPLAMLRGILSNPSCEIFITFMYEEINRFISLPEQQHRFDEIFGTPNWRNCLSIREPKARNRFLHDLYLQQLRDVAGARYVRSFQMRNAIDKTDYYLFYGTNNLLGLKKMKEAMWKVDEAGSFSFSDATDPSQLVLFSKEPQLDHLKRQILKKFAGKEAAIREIEEFVVAETAYRETHYKQILRTLELSDPPVVNALNASVKRRVGTYADPLMRLRFPPS